MFVWERQDSAGLPVTKPPNAPRNRFYNEVHVAMFNILGWIVFGLIVGAIARLLVPGRDPMGWIGTILLGVAGSLLGGFLGSLLFGRADELAETGMGFAPAGFLGALIGGIIVLLLVRQFRGRDVTDV